MKHLSFLLMFFALCKISTAQVSKTVSTTPGMLTYLLTPTEKSTVTNLTLNGTIDARDFKTMKSMSKLSTVDLGNVRIHSYTGTGGTINTSTNYYPADTIPTNVS